MFSSEHTICAVDLEVWQAIKAENKRQHEHIELTPRRTMPVLRGWKRRAAPEVSKDAFGMSMKHSIVFLDRGTLGAELRAPGFPHSYQQYAATPAQLVAERLRDATIAIINKVPMPAETLAQLPKLRLIAVAATGTDIVDKDYCRVKGITVVNIG